MAIGLFGGMFDPIHNGHLHAAEAVIKAFTLERLFFIPCATPAHRQAATASAEDRLAMLSLALKPYSNCHTDSCEVHREGPSFTIDTLRDFRGRYPHIPLLWLMGTDAMASLPSWHAWEKLLDYAHLVVLSRPDSPAYPPVVEDYLAAHQADRQQLLSNPAGYVHTHDIPLHPASSTQVRDFIAKKKSLQGLTPPAVSDYIESKNLY